MKRSLLHGATLSLLACAACRDRSSSSTARTAVSPGAPDPPAVNHGRPSAPVDSHGAATAHPADLIDVSGDDCTASALVYARTPGDTARVAFINDGCFGERIFLGIDGVKRELTRAENLPLGEGGPYRAGNLRVEVRRGRLLRRTLDYRPPDADCTGAGESEFSAVYQARVRVWSPRGERTFSGTLERSECRR